MQHGSKQLSIVYFKYFVVGITPPTALNISHKENTSMLDIHWNSDGNGYCIQYSAPPRLNGNWNHVTNASYTILLMNTTYKISISLHKMNMTSNFTIGMCTSVVARDSKN